MGYQKEILSIYHPQELDFLKPFLTAEEMKRIDDVGMHCGMEYTSFPFYCTFDKYSRFEHSLCVAYIIYHFTNDKKQSLAGLFHDIATPCFAHVIDFLKGDHVRQEITEERTYQIIDSSFKIQKELKKLSLTTSDVSNYHLYPIADNDSPKLSADRLEYTLHNFLNYHFASGEEVDEIYSDLIVDKNEDGEIELAFQHESIAAKFTLLTLKNSHIYVADEDRYGMEFLARTLKRLISLHYLKEDDLYTSESKLIKKLLMDEVSKKAWEKFRSLYKVEKCAAHFNDMVYKINSKKRYINPLVKGKGRIASLNKEVSQAIEEFNALSFNDYLIGFTSV